MKNHRLIPPTLILPALLLILTHQSAHAGSATWLLNPTSGDWNTAANWNPATVPNGPSDTAFFDQSNRINVSLSAATDVNGMTFNAAASAYAIKVGPGQKLTLSGTGVVNSSDTPQNFATSDDGLGFSNHQRGVIVFTNSATAGDGNTFTNNGTGFGNHTAATRFFGTSTAGTSTFINNASGEDFAGGALTQFFDESSAGASTIINNGPPGATLETAGGETDFFDNASAGSAILVATGTSLASDGGGAIIFFDQSTAENATITLESGGGVPGASGGGLGFEGNSTAGNANITANGAAAGGNEGAGVGFSDSASAGSATFVINGGEGSAGARVTFLSSASGGTAVFKIYGLGIFSIVLHDAPGMAVGSIEGDGTVQIGQGQTTLAVGTNNLSTTFSGLIQDTPSISSLSKVGTGTLTLSGANTYAGGTTIIGGTLFLTNATGSATGKGAVQVNNGTLGGRGIISGAVTVGTGSGAGAFLAPAAATKQQAVLTIQSGLTFNSDATYTYTLNAKKGKAKTDKVIANGVTINGAILAFQGTAQGALRSGLTLTAISNTAATPIAGAFANLPDGAILTVNGNNFQASYEGGDGNDLTLTVVP